MIKKITKIFLTICLVAITGTALSAKSSIIVGGGLQFDLGQLGGTIMKDGLDSTQGTKDSYGNYNGQQKLIIAENKLIAAENVSGGALNVKGDGAMTGGVLNFGFESDIGKAFFFRVGLNYTQKIMGGRTTSNFMGYNWYDITWNYRSIIIPAYFGIKIAVAESSAFYIGAGVHYFNGGWGVKGRNDGPGLNAASGGIGKSLVSTAADPAVINEDAQFHVTGFGMNWLLGAQTKISDKGSLFLELETILSAKQGTAGTKSTGGIAGLSPLPAYPIVLGGQIYRIGYKHEL